MSKRSKKAEREAAIKAEIARREADRSARSPIDRQQMISLISSIGSAIAENGHKNDFMLTDAWLEENNVDAFQNA